jgi:hypothetical protein
MPTPRSNIFCRRSASPRFETGRAHCQCMLTCDAGGGLSPLGDRAPSVNGPTPRGRTCPILIHPTRRLRRAARRLPIPIQKPLARRRARRFRIRRRAISRMILMIRRTRTKRLKEAGERCGAPSRNHRRSASSVASLKKERFVRPREIPDNVFRNDGCALVGRQLGGKAPKCVGLGGLCPRGKRKPSPCRAVQPERVAMIPSPNRITRDG